ncbi:hypothetical protein [Slackia heliotrinireducens]|uniref:hypothetical protein n=1 Tax=Slackia heliotrinireducens TaxID=84110 RepID=UPI0033146EED
MEKQENGKLDYLPERIHVITVMDYLAKNCTIDQMTVSAICNAARISRSSFYNLFDDKYDAANWYMCRALDLGNRHTGIHYTWYEGNLVTLSGCLIMRNLLKSAWHSPGYHAMKETGIRVRIQELEDVFAQRNLEINDEMRYQIEAFAYLESKLVRTWVSSDDPMPVETIAAYIVPCVPRDLHNALKDPIDPKPCQKLALSDLVMGIGELADE